MMSAPVHRPAGDRATVLLIDLVSEEEFDAIPKRAIIGATTVLPKTPTR
jgi:hypothetical protein